MATKVPFTESQWEELENQALVFKYLAAGALVPPHLLFLIERPFLFFSSSSSSSSSSTSSSSPPLFLHIVSQTLASVLLCFEFNYGVLLFLWGLVMMLRFLTFAVGWNVYKMGIGRKIDAEPGRCRRTDGKKWRCSKEAYPDSKYCERHMHRGKNCSSRKPLPLPPSPQFTPNLFLDSSLYSSRVRRRRSGYMDDFFSIEPSGSIKSFSCSTMEDDDGSCRNNYSFSKGEKQQDRHCLILDTDLGTRERPLMLEEKLKQIEEEEEEEEQRSKRVYRFLDEWPCSKSSVSTSLFI